MAQSLFIGLDVHADTIAVAIAEDGRKGEIRFYGTIRNTADALRRLSQSLSKNGPDLSFCYEAGPYGYGVYRLFVKRRQSVVGVQLLK